MLLFSVLLGCSSAPLELPAFVQAIGVAPGSRYPAPEPMSCVELDRGVCTTNTVIGYSGVKVLYEEQRAVLFEVARTGPSTWEQAIQQAPFAGDVLKTWKIEGTSSLKRRMAIKASHLPEAMQGFMLHCSGRSRQQFFALYERGVLSWCPDAGSQIFFTDNVPEQRLMPPELVMGWWAGPEYLTGPE